MKPPQRGLCKASVQVFNKPPVVRAPYEALKQGLCQAPLQRKLCEAPEQRRLCKNPFCKGASQSISIQGLCKAPPSEVGFTWIM